MFRGLRALSRAVHHIARDPRYSQVSAEDVSFFRSVLPSGVVTDKDELALFNTDWMKKYHGGSSVVLKPKTSEDISKILKYCNERRLAIVPQGGNTGLVGGSIPVFDEVILSTVNMTKVESFDELSGILVCQAGCILENLDKFVAEKGYMMPLDLGAKGSCHIGGNVSTNAGGIRLLRYGSLHGSVLGLEMVLPDGTIVDNLSSLRKDNTGYDLKQLFIGAEGTLGVVSKVSILTPKRPKVTNVAVLGFSSYANLLKAFTRARSELSEILSAFEFFDRESLDLTIKYLDCRDPLSTTQKFYALIETSGSNKDHDEEKLNTLLEGIIEQEVAEDGVMAMDSNQAFAFWKIREGITLALAKHGVIYKYDLSVPISKLYDLVEVMRERLGDKVTCVVGYGHLGDGNLHLNITAPKYDDRITDLIEPYVYEWTSSYRGSISAEHGLGQMKAPYLGFSKPKEAVDVMRRIKALFDPNMIMNPYKFLPPQ